MNILAFLVVFFLSIALASVVNTLDAIYLFFRRKNDEYFEAQGYVKTRFGGWKKPKK